jgi:hypothetical protein
MAQRVIRELPQARQERSPQKDWNTDLQVRINQLQQRFKQAHQGNGTRPQVK